MTKVEVILSVASLEPQTAELLCVAAWRAQPAMFGMRGFDFPDFNRFVAAVAGRKGMVGRGLLKKHEDGRLSLPGTAEATGPPLNPAVQHALCCTAFVCYDRGQKERVTFADALSFWGATYTNVGKAVERFDKLLADRDVSPDVRALANCHEYLQQRFARHIALVA